MSPILYHYLDMWRRCFDFSGRTHIRGFWWAFLCNVIASAVLSLFGLGELYGIIVLIPELAMTVRRLNDAGKHWLWVLINFIPLIGQIIFIIMLCQPSKTSDIIDV